MSFKPALLLLTTLTLSAQAKPASGATKTIAEITAGMDHRAGLLGIDYDAKTGKVHLEVPLTEKEHTRSIPYIYAVSLPWGVGQNDLGLDRGQFSGSQLVEFQRHGNKLLMVIPNTDFRTVSTDPFEQKAVRESFPESVLAGFTIEAEGDGVVLIDATDYFLKDAHGVSERLAMAKQGNYKVDASRSAIFEESTKAFPKNIAVEAVLTFATDDPSKARLVGNVTPDAHAMTVHERHSFVEPPPAGYTPRRYSPRAGYFDNEYRDMNVALGEQTEQRFIRRHRLIKKDPNCKVKCEAVKPIQYYIDPGAMEPVRTALLEGARWWDEAFQAAGWAPGTFKVDILPAGADPMDVRYNIIEWVHRYNRGWSYGAEIDDPRTGEIIKGTVTLGSLRGRQDYLIAEALTAPYKNGMVADAEHDPATQMVLARIRQLAAHETGHTLGLAHNYIDSTIQFPGKVQSVMEYPHPYITLDAKGIPDLSHAYQVGIGTWDKVAIDYGYRQFAKDEDTQLEAILTTAEKKGLAFISDSDARPFGSAHPYAHLWDNGTDPADELNRVLEVRKAALARFGEDNIRNGEPLAKLADVLVPLYLFHRYETEAAAKMIGGLDYRYQVRGDGQMSPKVLDVALQQKAMDAVLKTLSPETLNLPETLWLKIPPMPQGYRRSAESFASHTGLTFDPIAAAESAADLTLKVLLDPTRAARIVEYHMFVAKSPSFRVLLENVSKVTAERPENGHSTSSEVERAVEFRGLEAMFALASDNSASSQVRAITVYHLKDLLKTWASEPRPTDTAEAIHRDAMVDRINTYFKQPEKFEPAPTVIAPPGMPIGSEL